ncbi:MAG TPA: hypothetical protein VK766_02820 [Cytophagaceae bacterium]|jgi:hypothetical protein|nr:hypothetical protein [Cytophagaceae bacterium]
MAKNRVIVFLKMVFLVLSLIIISASLLTMLLKIGEEGFGISYSILLIIFSVLDLIIIKELIGIRYRDIVHFLSRVFARQRV